MKLVFVLVALGFLKTVWIYKTCHSLPLAELKRRARGGDHKAGDIYKLAAYGRGLDGLVWLIGLSLAIVLVLWCAAIAWWAATLAVLVMLWLAALAPMPSPGGLAWNSLAFFAPRLAKVLERLKPVLNLLAHLVPVRQTHHGIYEKEDLLEVLHVQNRQPGNRIAEADLQTAQHTLTFADKKVADVMVPVAKARFVLGNEPIGPMLMDELHKTGQTRFGIVKEEVKNPLPAQITGSLYLPNLLKNLESSNHVSSIASPYVAYINESSNLGQALDALAKTSCNLLIVVNKFKEVVGLLTIEQVLQQMLGYVPAGDFNDYQSLGAVVGQEAAEQSDA